MPKFWDIYVTKWATAHKITRKPVMAPTLSAPNPLPIPRHEFFRIVGTGLGAILLTHGAVGCNRPDNDTSFAPGAARQLDFTLDLNDDKLKNLKTKGGYLVVNDVLVAHTKDGRFVAVSPGCTHEQTRLVYRLADNQFYCPLDLSRFDTAGNVVVGPATQALKRYTVVTDALTSLIRVHS